MKYYDYNATNIVQKTKKKIVYYTIMLILNNNDVNNWLNIVNNLQFKSIS